MIIRYLPPFFISAALLVTFASAASGTSNFPFIALNINLDGTLHVLKFPDPEVGESVHNVVTKFSNRLNISDTNARKIEIRAHRMIARKIEFYDQKNFPALSMPAQTQHKAYPFAVRMWSPRNLDCVDGRPKGTDVVTVQFEMAEHSKERKGSEPEFPLERIEICSSVLASGMRNETTCFLYNHGSVDTSFEAMELGFGPVRITGFFRLKRTKEIIAKSSPVNVLVLRDCIDYVAQGDRQLVTEFQQGYCEPELACPEKLPIAYLGSPRSGSTMMKRMIVNQLEAGEFISHTSQKMRCCNSLAHGVSMRDRLPIFISRNPYSRAVSTFFHSYANPFLIPEENDGLYLKLHASFGEEWIPKFEKWLRFVIESFPTDDLDSTFHLKSQLGHFHSPTLQGLPHQLNRFHILHLETIDEDWSTLEQLLCNMYPDNTSDYALNSHGECRLPCAPENNGKAKKHNMSALATRPDLLKLIQERYHNDFKVLGYSTDVANLMPLVHTDGKLLRVPSDVNMETLCAAQERFANSACTRLLSQAADPSSS